MASHEIQVKFFKKASENEESCLVSIEMYNKKNEEKFLMSNLTEDYLPDENLNDSVIDLVEFSVKLSNIDS